MLKNLFSSTLIYKLYLPILTIVVSVLVYYLGRKMIRRAFDLKIKKNKNTKRQKTLESLFTNILKYILFVIAVLIILGFYGVNTTAILASLGVVGLVFGLAFQDTIKDLLAGIFVILDNEYNVGDFVKIDNFEGEVIEFGLKSTKIKAFSGEVKVIANSGIATVINYSLDNAVRFVDISVDYNTDLDKCEKVLRMVCEDLSKTLKGLKSDLQLLGVQELASSSIVYRIKIEAPYLDIFALRREILKDIKITLDKHKIKIPYNKLEVVNEK